MMTVLPFIDIPNLSTIDTTHVRSRNASEKWQKKTTDIRNLFNERGDPINKYFSKYIWTL